MLLILNSFETTFLANTLNSLQKYLLPNFVKLIGWLFILAGILFGIIRFYYGVKLSFLDVKWFAIYSNYLQAKWFVPTESNFGEEVPAILFLLGLVLIASSKEKNESEELNELRIKSIIIALLVNTLFLLLSNLFVFGIGFIDVLMINMFSIWVFYLMIFQIQKAIFFFKMKKN